MYRDPRFGLTVVSAGSSIGPKFFSTTSPEPIVNGQTHDGIFFSIQDAEIETGMTQTVIDGRLGFVGTAEADISGPWPEHCPRFDNLSVWIDWLPEFLAGSTTTLINIGNRGLLNLPPPEQVGAVAVVPRASLRSSAFDVGVTAVRLDLSTTRRRTIDWWVENWVTPLQQLVTIGLGVPATVTLLATKTNRQPDRHPDFHDWLYIIGRHWPTMQLQSFEPPSLTYTPVHLPLLSWSDPAFDLTRIMPALRSTGRTLEFAVNSYTGTIYGDLLARHYFLNLIQAAESFHVKKEGKERPDSTLDVEALMARLKGKGVSRKDRKALERAVNAQHPRTYRLEERLAKLRSGRKLPAPPGIEPDWLDAGERRKITTWEAQIARARNDISHGEATPSETWLRTQCRYLRMVVEHELLRSLGLPKSYCASAATDRYERSRQI